MVGEEEAAVVKAWGRQKEGMEEKKELGGSEAPMESTNQDCLTAKEGRPEEQASSASHQQVDEACRC